LNTPAHLVLNTLVLGRGRWQDHWPSIMAGALLPDLPILCFYAYQSLVLRNPERLIWTQAYFAPDWQAFFDLFNSLPLIALFAVLAWRARARGLFAFFCSMALHCLGDLPLHHDDGHAHFFPLSSWRFQSPISYWDPEHHGHFVLLGEMLLIVVGAYALARPQRPRGLRMTSVGLLVATVCYAGYAIVVWGAAGG